MLELVLLLISVLIILFQVVLDKHRKDFCIFNFKYIFQIYYVIQLNFSNVLATLFEYSIADSRLQYYVDDRLRDEVSVCILLGHIFFVLGTIMLGSVQIHMPSWYLRKWSVTKSKYLIIVLLAVEYLFFELLMLSQGGFSAFIANLAIWRNTGLIGNGIYIFFISVAGQIVPLLFLVINKDKIIKDNKTKLEFILLLMLITIPIGILGFSGSVAYVILEVIVIYYFYCEKFSLRKLTILTSILLLFLIMYGIVRANNMSIVGLELTIEREPELLMRPFLRTRGSEIMARIIDNTNEFRLGYETLFQSLTIFVPHAIWAEKPEPISVVFSEEMYGLNGGISPTILGDLYWNFGYFGITLGMLIIGATVQIIYNSLKKYLDRPSVIFVYAHMFLFFTVLVSAIPGPLNDLVMKTIFFVPIVYWLSV